MIQALQRLICTKTSLHVNNQRKFISSFNISSLAITF